MKKNNLLDEFRKSIPEEIKREIDLSFEIADRIHVILQKRGISQRAFADLLGKRESEISKWLRGTHNFTTQTIARIEAVLHEPIIEVTGKPNKPEYIYCDFPADYSFASILTKSEVTEVPFGDSWVIASCYESTKSVFNC